MKIAIFGSRENGELAAHYISRDENQLKALVFVEDSPETRNVDGISVESVENFLIEYSKEDWLMFAPLALPRNRTKIYNKFKSLGYRFYSYISPQAEVWDRKAIGENCFIQEFNNVQYKTYLEDNCSLWAGNHVGHHGLLKSGTTLTSHVCISGRCNIGRNTYFGVNSSVRDGLSVANESVIAMGATVTKDISEGGVYMGSPAIYSKPVGDLLG